MIVPVRASTGAPLRRRRLPSRLRAIAIAVAFVAPVLAATPASAAPIISVWSGGAGQWTDPNWSTSSSTQPYPNNNGNTYSVFIEGGSTEPVTLAGSAPPIVVDSIQGRFRLIVNGSLTTGIVEGQDNALLSVASGGRMTVRGDYKAQTDNGISVGTTGAGRLTIGGSLTGAASGLRVGSRGGVGIGGDYRIGSGTLSVDGGRVSVGGDIASSSDFRADLTNNAVVSARNLVLDGTMFDSPHLAVRAATLRIDDALTITPENLPDHQPFRLSVMESGRVIVDEAEFRATTPIFDPETGGSISIPSTFPVDISGPESALVITNALNTSAAITVSDFGRLRAGTLANLHPGTLTVQGGGRVGAGSFANSGTVIVRGSESVLRVDDQLHSSEGPITVEGGATLRAGSIFLSQANLAVRDPGSAVITGDFTGGSEFAGVDVLNGAALRAERFSTGPFDTTVLVEGTGSRLQAGTYVQPASNENATLVRDRGVLQIGSGGGQFQGGRLVLDNGVVWAGELSLGSGSFGEPGVSTSARLEGTGLLAGPPGAAAPGVALLVQGGQIAPGQGEAPHTIGRIDIDGDLTMESGLIEIDIADRLHSDVLDVSGNADFRGGRIVFYLIGEGLQQGEGLDFLDAGAFSGLDALGFELFGARCRFAAPDCFSVLAHDNALTFVANVDLFRVPEPSTLVLLLTAALLLRLVLTMLSMSARREPGNCRSAARLAEAKPSALACMRHWRDYPRVSCR